MAEIFFNSIHLYFITENQIKLFIYMLYYSFMKRRFQWNNLQSNFHSFLFCCNNNCLIKCINNRFTGRFSNVKLQESFDILRNFDINHEIFSFSYLFQSSLREVNFSLKNYEREVIVKTSIKKFRHLNSIF